MYVENFMLLEKGLDSVGGKEAGAELFAGVWFVGCRSCAVEFSISRHYSYICYPSVTLVLSQDSRLDECEGFRSTS